jgi:crotonobetainyl-CoA:carnitine CoA-transferase CaiB-like acyl-CoA transferase
MRLTVLDLTRLLPGAYATHLLQQMGARVIKIEDPRHGDYLRDFPFPLEDGMSAYFHAVNRGKESVAVDLTTSPHVLLELARHADVLIESYRPGVVERLGVDYASVIEYNRRIIYASLTGYGHNQESSNHPSHDLNYLALAGLLDLSRGRDGLPAIPALQVADIAAGSLFAAVRILQALLERDEQNHGAYLDISMLGGLSSLMSFTAAPVVLAKKDLNWDDFTLNGQIACYNVYPAKDGRWLAVANLEQKFWCTFCEVLGRPEWRTRQFDRTPQFQEQIRQLLETKTRAEWEAIFAGKDTCVTPVRTLHEAAAHNIFVYSDHPPPKLGEHTKQVLLEFGISGG